MAIVYNGMMRRFDGSQIQIYLELIEKAFSDYLLLFSTLKFIFI
jgi:hypothetical protein